MVAARYVRLPIRVGARWSRNIYFYQSHDVLWDAQFHWSYTSGMHPTLQDAIRDFLSGLTRHHNLECRGLSIQLGQGVETNWDEVAAVRASMHVAAAEKINHWYFCGP